MNDTKYSALWKTVIHLIKQNKKSLNPEKTVFISTKRFIISEQNLLSFRLNERTYSLWGYMWQSLPDYINPFFKDGAHGVLIPSSHPQQFRYVFFFYIYIYIYLFLFCSKSMNKFNHYETYEQMFSFRTSFNVL